MIRYSGVFAPNSRLRRQIVPKEEATDVCEDGPSHPTLKKRYGWGRLMARVFEIDVYSCPRCKSQMQTISFVTAPQAIVDILKCLKMATAPPEIARSSFREEQTDIYYDYDFAG